ncbi:MAG: universal stress protein [Burkholderiales bacterium]|nr:universal stress protein [Burkholderiales bacterium]
MAIKTILVHIDESKRVNERIDVAIKLAQIDNAHLIGTALTGVSRFLNETVSVNPDDPNIIPYLDTLRRRADKSLDKFKADVRRLSDIPFETRLIDDEAAGGLSLHAIYADVVVLGQFDPDESLMAAQPNLPEYVAMNSGCPVLLVPHSTMAKSIGERVLIAWNGSLEAKRAVHHALPILQRAKVVEVISFTTVKQRELYGDQPAADLAAYLARHNITVDAMQEETSSDAGEALLSLAANLSSDLLVMGCYGHSRLREIMLGGVSRTILNSATIPVLLAH